MSEGYPSFPSIARWNRDVTVTEKIDGTNGLIDIRRETLGTALDFSENLDELPFALMLDTSELDEVGEPTHEFHIWAGSRNRWLTPGNDNFTFARWVFANRYTLIEDLQVGRHYGEWYGQGIQRTYGLAEKRFMLFNTKRHDGKEFKTPQLETSTVLWEGNMKDLMHTFNGYNFMSIILGALENDGSKHVPGFMKPEGVVIYHHAANKLFKITLENDEVPKSKVKNV